MKTSINYIYIILTTIFLGLLPNFCMEVKAKEFVVVIDAGHGGNDAGAVDNNATEKSINLNVALQLETLIKKNLKNVKVVLTRSDDTFRTLQERAEIANKSKGDLFISIHTNSVDKNNKNRTTVAGASVYTLGQQKESNNMNVARRENSVIQLEKNYEQKYQGFDPDKDESYIIFEMAQRKNLSKSIRLANDIEKQLVTTAGRKSRGVHQAGFWVLWATSMPAVLVELDFICNPSSAEYLTSKDGEKQMATAIYNAVKTYIAHENSSAEVAPSPMQLRKEEEARQKHEELAAKKEVSTDVAKNQKKEKSVINTSRRRTQAQHLETFYSIQICATAEQIKDSDPRFCGLSPVKSFRENNLYKYTYGESRNKSEVEALLPKIRKNFPDAFIIETKKSVN